MLIFSKVSFKFWLIMNWDVCFRICHFCYFRGPYEMYVINLRGWKVGQKDLKNKWCLNLWRFFALNLISRIHSWVFLFYLSMDLFLMVYIRLAMHLLFSLFQSQSLSFSSALTWRCGERRCVMVRGQNSDILFEYSSYLFLTFHITLDIDSG